jgi:hypothetical protein
MEKELSKNRYNDDEFQIIKSLFGGEKGLKNLKLLRKVFSPEYDYDLPIGRQQDKILWQNLDQMMAMAPADREIAILSQIKLTRHIETQLQGLFYLASQKETTVEELAEKMRKNSAK